MKKLLLASIPVLVVIPASIAAYYLSSPTVVSCPAQNSWLGAGVGLQVVGDPQPLGGVVQSDVVLRSNIRHKLYVRSVTMCGDSWKLLRSEYHPNGYLQISSRRILPEHGIATVQIWYKALRCGNFKTYPVVTVSTRPRGGRTKTGSLLDQPFRLLICSAERS